MKNRQRILDIIRALRAKTIQNSCSEAEASAAAAKAAELLERYGIQADELEEAPKDEFVSEEFRSDQEVVSARLWRVANAIGKLTDTKNWTSHKTAMKSSIETFFGHEADVAIAVYLLEVCARAMNSLSEQLLADMILLRPNVRRRRHIAFMDGLTDTLCRRINEITWARQKAIGKGLILRKMDIVEAAMKGTGVSLRYTRNGRDSLSQDTGYEAGVSAANDISLNAGLAGSGAARMLSDQST
ncbi:conserved hypothetical protein [Hyphomicrobiales bacterium]|jgi:hypothetical protein|nr:conserved hypothetical protein [Hyphomicrobiales bacterium]CAH1702263.1 conserved hypothetical protein [Hyphomicrobiales bacterium]CAI0346466.1 DUF2786 domain-containing protein [Hyphomicrobiales bacterium]